MTTRMFSRLGALGVLVGAWLASMSTSPVFALRRDDGDDPGKQISTLHALLLFGVAPICGAALIALIAGLPYLIKGPKYRPGRDWDAQPEWYGAPAVEGEGHEPKKSLEGAKAEALTGTIVDAPEDGGSSARW